MLLPFLGSAEVTQIGEEEINFEVEVRMQVVRLYIQLRPEQNYIVHFDFFLAVSNQESLWEETSLLVHDLRRHQVVLIRTLFTRLISLLLLIVGNVAAIRLCILDLLISIHCTTGQATCCDTVSALGCCSLRARRAIYRLNLLVTLLAAAIVIISGGASTAKLPPLFLGMYAEPRIINTLEEKVNVTEGLEVHHDFNDGAQRHICYL